MSNAVPKLTLDSPEYRAAVQFLAKFDAFVDAAPFKMKYAFDRSRVVFAIEAEFGAKIETELQKNATGFVGFSAVGNAVEQDVKAFSDPSQDAEAPLQTFAVDLVNHKGETLEETLSVVCSPSTRKQVVKFCRNDPGFDETLRGAAECSLVSACYRNAEAGDDAVRKRRLVKRLLVDVYGIADCEAERVAVAVVRWSAAGI